MYKLKHIVKTSELGPNQTMRVTNMINLTLDCEMMHIDSLTIFNKYLKENKIGIFLTFRQLDIYDYPRFKDNLTVVTSPYETKAFLGFRNTIIYHDDKLIAASYSLGNFVYLDTNLPARVPDEVIKSIISSERFKMEYTNRKIIIDDNFRLINCDTQIITKTQIDLYIHVNNMYYIEFCYNRLPDNFTFNRIRSEYKMPLKYGDTATIKLYQSNNIITGQIHNQNEQLCAVIEFSSKDN